MKYRVLRNICSISRGEFVAYVENGYIELPEDIGDELVRSGEITPATEEEISNDGLHDFSGSETSTRKRRKRG